MVETPKHQLMKCGHVAQAIGHDGEFCCAICIGLDVGAKQIADTPDLTGRVATCWDCRREKPSSLDLPLFEHRQDGDRFYCGCRGWD